jgi:hypothetical protein
MANDIVTNLPLLAGGDIADGDALYVADVSEAGLARSKHTTISNLLIKTKAYTDTLYAVVGHNHAGVYSPVGHQHDAADIITGVINHARLGSGGGGASKFLREDG